MGNRHVAECFCKGMYFLWSFYFLRELKSLCLNFLVELKIIFWTNVSSPYGSYFCLSICNVNYNVFSNYGPRNQNYKFLRAQADVW